MDMDILERERGSTLTLECSCIELFMSGGSNFTTLLPPVKYDFRGILGSGLNW